MEKRILLIIGGGIAAYKAPELIRQLRAQNFAVRCLATAAATQFVAPLSLASVSGDKVYENLFDLTDEAEMGHIQLSRDADMIVVAPATADLIARMAQGMANDLAGATLLATDKPVLIAPAMNVRMWEHPATQRNIEKLRGDGIGLIGPEQGDMACGEFGPGRMSEPTQIADWVVQKLHHKQAENLPLNLEGRKILVTAAQPASRLTRCAILPIILLANRAMRWRLLWPIMARKWCWFVAPRNWPTRPMLRLCAWKPRNKCWPLVRRLCPWMPPLWRPQWPIGGLPSQPQISLKNRAMRHRQLSWWKTPIF